MPRTSAENETWLTPPEYIRTLGPFDTDPCCPPNMPWRTATTMYTKADDGLKSQWFGRVWLNPPFGLAARVWLRELALHGNGIAFVPARTETELFKQSVWGVADAVCFLSTRPKFFRIDGTPAPFNAGAPMVFVAYGAANAERLRASGYGFTVQSK